MRKLWPLLVLGAGLALPVVVVGGLLARGRASVPDEPPLRPLPSEVSPGPEVWAELQRVPELPAHEQGAALEELYRRGGLSFPTVDPLGAGPDLRPVLDLLKARSAEALVLEDGREALRQVITCLAWGLRIKDAEGSLMSLVTGAVVAEDALSQLEALLGQRPELRESALALLQGLPRRQSSPRAVVEECESLARLFEDEERLLGEVGSTGPAFAQSWLIDGHANAAWQRAWCREILAQLVRPPELRELVPFTPRWEGAGPERFVHNPGGRVLADLASPDLMAFAEREDQVLAHMRELIDELGGT